MDPLSVLDKDAVVVPLCEDEVWKFSQRNKYKLIQPVDTFFL
jgi:hypothetical protein